MPFPKIKSRHIKQIFPDGRFDVAVLKHYYKYGVHIVSTANPNLGNFLYGNIAVGCGLNRDIYRDAVCCGTIIYHAAFLAKFIDFIPKEVVDCVEDDFRESPEHFWEYAQDCEVEHHIGQVVDYFCDIWSNSKHYSDAQMFIRLVAIMVYTMIDQT
jgi:hypothetical protein